MGDTLSTQGLELTQEQQPHDPVTSQAALDKLIKLVEDGALPQFTEEEARALAMVAKLWRGMEALAWIGSGTSKFLGGVVFLLGVYLAFKGWLTSYLLALVSGSTK